MRSVDVAGTGFAVLDRVYAAGARATWEALGGSCGNVLVSLAMLRRRVAPILTLGHDDTGRRLVDEFTTAGAETMFIRRRMDRRSPVLAQIVDPAIGTHSFAWTCPDTSEALPRYAPVEAEEVETALPVLRRCAVFYVDRVTEAVADAMEVAATAGAIVFFEPSERHPSAGFERALAAATILKCSADRIPHAPAAGARTITIVTHGEAGLEVSGGGDRRWLDPHPAPDVRDTCGSGDMVSVGLIHWLLSIRPGAAGLDVASLIPGIRAGQRLAAENCAYVGARGLFRHRGAEAARAILEG